MDCNFLRWLKLAKSATAALLFGVPVSSYAVSDLVTHALERNASAFPVDLTLEQWRSYALADITPAFSWAILPGNSRAPSLLDGIVQRTPTFTSSKLPLSGQSHFLFKIESTRLSDSPSIVIKNGRNQLLPGNLSGVEQYKLSSSIAQPWGHQGLWSISAILAYQHFSTHGLGSLLYKEGYVPRGIAEADEGSFGTGLRVDVGSTLNSRLSWNVGLQSRVNMDAFNNHRGVYSEPGDFDIPASAELNFNVKLTPTLAMDFSAQRVMYSGITPFTSSLLPTRFLALLGDGISPEFAWRDLTVYSAGWSWRDPLKNNWSLQYSTREQPSPTSHLLQQALKPQFSNYSLDVAFRRYFGESTDLRIVASYAPAQYVVGDSFNFSQSDEEGGNRLEVEALLAYRF